VGHLRISLTIIGRCSPGDFGRMFQQPLHPSSLTPHISFAAPVAVGRTPDNLLVPDVYVKSSNDQR